MLFKLIKYILFVVFMVLVFLGISSVYKPLKKKLESFDENENENDNSKDTKKVKAAITMFPTPNIKDNDDNGPSNTISNELSKMKQFTTDLLQTATKLNQLVEQFNASSLHTSMQKQVDDESVDVYDQYDYDIDVKKKKITPKRSNAVNEDVDGEVDDVAGDVAGDVDVDDDDEERDVKHKNEHGANTSTYNGRVALHDGNGTDGDDSDYEDNGRIDYTSMNSNRGRRSTRNGGVKGMLQAEETFNMNMKKQNSRSRNHKYNDFYGDDNGDDTPTTNTKLHENFTCGYDGITSPTCLNCLSVV